MLRWVIVLGKFKDSTHILDYGAEVFVYYHSLGGRVGTQHVEEIGVEGIEGIA